MDFSKVKEILVTMSNGKKLLYKDKGLEKFKRDITKVKAREEVTVIDEESDDSEEEDSGEDVEVVAPPPQQHKKVPKKVTSSNVDILSSREGVMMPTTTSSRYHSTVLEYTPSTDTKSAAAKMRADAEAGGIKFS